MAKHLMTLRQKRLVPSAPGVYRLFMGEELIYLGASKNMRKRITQHELRGLFDRVVAEEYRAPEAD